MKTKFVLRALAVSMSACSFISLANGAERKPNVVLILIDDFGYECVTADGGESGAMW